MPVSYQSAPLPSHLSLPNGLMNTVAAAAVKEIMNGLSKSVAKVTVKRLICHN